MAENRPIHQVRIGRIKAAVFDNGADAPRKVQFTALYKDGETWKGSQSFTRSGLAPSREGRRPGSHLPLRAKRFFRRLDTVS